MKHYTYKGFEYYTWDDVKEDNIKMYHECRKAGREIKMPDAFYNHSPYSLVSLDEFVAFIQQIELVEFVRG